MEQTATVDPTPVEASPATPEIQEPAGASAGTVEQVGSQAQAAAPTEESFFSGDPKSLPPELQTAYKNMLKDYKNKTKDIAEVRKKATAYDQLSTDQRFRDYWTGLSKQEKTDFKQQKQEVEKALGERITDEEFANSFNSKGDFLGLLEKVVEEKLGKSQERIQELEHKLTQKDAEEVVESFATEVGPDGKPLRPDFYGLNDEKYGLISGFLSIYPPENQSREAYVNKLNEAYTWAKTLTQDFYNKGKQEALGLIQKKAAASSELPTQAAKGVYSGRDPKKLSVREAIELAKKGERIPQVYD